VLVGPEVAPNDGVLASQEKLAFEDETPLVWLDALAWAATNLDGYVAFLVPSCGDPDALRVRDDRLLAGLPLRYSASAVSRI
jgi:hypothetical protein